MKLSVRTLFPLVAGITSAPLFALGGTPPLAPPPVTIMPATPPAPVIYASSRPVRPQLPVLVGIDVIGGGEQLWNGQLRVAGAFGASLNSSVNETPEPCATDTSGFIQYPSTNTRSLRLRLERRDSVEQIDRFYVSVSWSRPGVPCDGSGTLTVGLEKFVTLKKGASTEVRGDGDLLVRLKRID